MRSFRIAQIISLLAIFFAASAARAVTTESVLHAFPAFVNDARTPDAPLIQGSDGFLYGTTNLGGTHGHGTVFKIATDGSGYQVIHNFAGGAGDGFQPLAGLVQASDGNLYGTTTGGGASNRGVIFEIGTDGSGFQLVHSFAGGTSDGSNPLSNPIQATDGFLYGVAGGSGANGEGILYKFGVGGTGYQIIYSFGASGTDGKLPSASLYQGPDGFLYGTTSGGGSSGGGTVFKILPNGTGYLILHSFTGAPTDGIDPIAPVVEAPDGLLYGTTEFGGTSTQGVLFKIAPDGSGYSAFRLLNGTDGSSPLGGFTVANDGKLYGATQGNGTNTNGSIFSIAQGGGSFTLVYNFGTNLNDGSDPLDSPVLASDGSFYGTTAGGGANADGIVFKLTTGLLAAPAGLNAVAGSQECKLSWYQDSPATSYNVYMGTTSGGESGTPVATGLTVPSFFSTGLTNGTTYFFKVSAIISSVETAKSSEVSATPQAAASLHTFPAGLQMIAVPADYTGWSPWQAFDDAGNVTLADWTGTAYALTPISPANTMVPTVGSWVRFAAPADLLDIGADVVGTPPTTETLTPGWNMVSVPFSTGVATSSIQVTVGSNTMSLVNANKAGIVGPTFFTWQVGDSAYEQIPISGSTLSPFESYWLFDFQSSKLVM